MLLKFYKYHGTGNDFILIDNRTREFTTSAEIIRLLCDRHFGIGADGLMTLENDTENDFRMRYFNADGQEGTMCGNGGRCIVHFAKETGIIQGNSTVFSAIDGIHQAKFSSEEIIKLRMNDVSAGQIKNTPDGFLLDTGSPHLVRFENEIDSIDVFVTGKKLRYLPAFEKQNGINVNFVEINDDFLKVRTYERGVEAETLSCGTGSIAVALAFSIKENIFYSPVNIKTLGGDLKVHFQFSHNSFHDIWLEGPVKFVFSTQININ